MRRRVRSLRNAMIQIELTVRPGLLAIDGASDSGSNSAANESPLGRNDDHPDTFGSDS